MCPVNGTPEWLITAFDTGAVTMPAKRPFRQPSMAMSRVSST